MFLLLETTTRGYGSGRFLSQLERFKRIRLPSVWNPVEVSGKDQERRSDANPNHTVLAQLHMVSTPVRDVIRHSPSSSAERESIIFSSRSSSPPVPRREAHPHRLETLRDRWSGGGLSPAAVELLLAGTRKTTHAAYQSAWSAWHCWCLQRDLDPLSGSLNPILEYLTELHESGKSYSLLNIHRSMLSSMIDQPGFVPVGQLPAVKQLLKGAYNRNPPKPKYSHTWDVNIVLEYIALLGMNEELGLHLLSRKLAMLLALSTLLRVSELNSIVFSSIEFSNFGVSFHLGRTQKAQHSGALRVIRLPKLNDPILCPVHCLGIYRALTEAVRTPECKDSLFISLIQPYRQVTVSTVSHWIKSILSESGIDPAFSAHSTRGAAASHAISKGVPVDSILKAGSWASESTFTRFYRRETTSTRLAGAVLTRHASSQK